MACRRAAHTACRYICLTLHSREIITATNMLENLFLYGSSLTSHFDAVIYKCTPGCGYRCTTHNTHFCPVTLLPEIVEKCSFSACYDNKPLLKHASHGLIFSSISSKISIYFLVNNSNVSFYFFTCFIYKNVHSN